MKRAAFFILPALFWSPVLSAAQETNDPVARYNAGTKQYMKGAFGEAEKALSQALSAAAPALQARAAYNLAGAQYKQGVGLALKNPDAAKKFFGQALDNYRLGIRRNFRDRDAQYNYELTQKHLELLKQEEQKQEKQQANTQKSQDQKGQGQEQEARKQQAQTGQEKKEQAEAGKSEEKQAAKQEDAKQARVADRQDKEQDKQQAKAAAPQAGEKEEGEASKELSQQQALWILDNMQREEYGARTNHAQQSVHESNVDQDW